MTFRVDPFLSLSIFLILFSLSLPWIVGIMIFKGLLRYGVTLRIRSTTFILSFDPWKILVFSRFVRRSYHGILWEDSKHWSVAGLEGRKRYPKFFEKTYGQTHT